MAKPKRSALRESLDRRKAVQSGAMLNLEQRLDELSENLARRLGAVLGIDPDDVYAPDGSDGVRVGATNFETAIDGLNDPDRVKAAVLASSLDEIGEFVEASGMDRARNVMRDSMAELAGLAERSATAAGVVGADGALDTAAASALLGNYIDNRITGDLFGIMTARSAARIRIGLESNLGLMSLTEVAQSIGSAEQAAIPATITEARTTLAEGDRFANEVVRESVDPDGEDTLLAYLGPDDGITRDFCSHLVNKAFEINDFAAANNHQTPTHPRYSGGGYNCRHDVTPVPNSPAALAALGMEKGTANDVAQASSAALAARKKKKKRKRKR
jgi:hypothetical protein